MNAVVEIDGNKLTQTGIVEEALDELEQLADLKIAAGERFSAAVKKVAEDAKIEKTVLSQFVMARVRDKLAEFERNQGQMQLLFSEIE